MNKTKNSATKILITFRLYTLFTKLYVGGMARLWNIELIRKNGIVTVKKKGRIIRVSEKHGEYVPDLIREFDTYFYSIEPTFENNLMIVDYSQPAIHTLSKSKKAFLFTSLPESEEVTDIYLEKAGLKNGDIVFDLGAYCGATAYAFAQDVGSKGHVYAFEPDIYNYDALVNNIQRHGLKNVTPVKKGIWSANTRLAFSAEGNLGSGVAGILNRKSTVTEIEVVTIPYAVEEFGIDHIEFIKMDIEGSEIEALKASEYILKKFRPKLIIEPHYVQGQITTKKVCKLLKELSYSYEIIKQGSSVLPFIFAKPISS